MKKVLAMALALLMVAVLLPVTAMAEGSATLTENSVAKLTIGENVTYYDSLVEAVAAAKSRGLATIDMLKSSNGSGIMVKAAEPVNLTINFHGYTYTMDGTTVGSPGTESQAWHVERGSKLTLKDGKLEATATLPYWLLFQNYCDLTLENMEVNASKANCDYVISNNFGSLTVKGNSQIIAAEGKVAFDVYYWPNGGYGDGVTVTFDDSFTGKVDGNIEYGTDGSDGGKANWSEKAKLNINGNGTFTGEISAYNLGTENNDPKDAAITVTGGTFTNADTQALVANFIPDDMQINNNGTVVEKQHTVIIITDDSTDTTTTTETAGNPATGANDFVGAAAALAVVSLLGIAAVTRKK